MYVLIHSNGFKEPYCVCMGVGVVVRVKVVEVTDGTKKVWQARQRFGAYDRDAISPGRCLSNLTEGIEARTPVKREKLPWQWQW